MNIQLILEFGIFLVVATLKKEIIAEEETVVGLLTEGVKRGGNAELSCDVKSNNTLHTLYWTFEGEPSSLAKTIAKQTYKPGMIYRFIADKEKCDLKNDSYNLNVFNMRPSMEGYYTCFADNIVMNKYKLYLSDSCTITNIKKSVKEGKLFLTVSTPSDNLRKYFVGAKVNVECNGMVTEICGISLLNPNNTNCDFLAGLSSQYLIIVRNSEKYQLCNVYVTLIRSSVCFTHEVWNVTIKAEDEGQIATEQPTSFSQETVSTKKPSSAPDDTITTSKPSSAAVKSIGNPVMVILIFLGMVF